jgi:hypothetical protein
MTGNKKNKKALDAEITNALLDDFDKFEHFAANYWKQFAGVAIAIVITVALWVMISDARKASERKINDTLCNAKSETEIIAAIKKHANYPATHYARLRLAKIYLNEKKYDKAYEQFKLLRASNIPREMTWRIALDEAYALELEGKKPMAAAKFASLGSDYSLPDGFRGEANYSAGRLYLDLKETEKARKYLSKVAKVQAGGINSQATEFWRAQAKFMLIRLAKPSKTPATKTKK